MIGRQYAGQKPPVLESGVIIAGTSADPAARLSIKTAQGNFFFDAGEVPLGAQKKFLDGKVAVDHVPDTLRLADWLEDDDFPAIAQDSDAVWLAYVQFPAGAGGRGRGPGDRALSEKGGGERSGTSRHGAGAGVWRECRRRSSDARRCSSCAG